MGLTSAVGRFATAAALVISMTLGTAPASAEDAPPLAAATDAGRTAAYVQSVYEDLFGREPDAGGAATWTRALLAGTPRVAVANSITSSEEFRSGLISDVYEDYLGRGPDAGGLRFWLGEMARGRTVAQMQSGFIASDEYWSAAGGTPAGWVTALYQDVLDRDPAPAEVGYWVQRIGGGATRGQVALGFLLSTEHLSTVVDGYYQWLLGRGLDPVGQRSWVGILQAGGRDEAIIGGIVGSDEYWGLVTGILDVTALRVVLPSEVPASQHVPVQVLGLGADGRALVDLSDVATLFFDDLGWKCGHGYCDMSTRAGRHTVMVWWSSLRASVVVTVVPGETEGLSAWTSEAFPVAGESLEVHTSALDGAGNATPVTPDSIVSDAGGSCAGSVCTFTSAGGHHLTVTAQGFSTTLYLAVSAGPFARLEIDPASATLTSGAGQGYAARWLDAYGNAVPPAAVLTVTVDGTTCPYGVCAPSGLGSHTVVATAGSVSTSASLTVVPPGPTASRLFGWGVESDLGNGGDYLIRPLMQVGVDTHWASIAAGSNHMLGLTSDGALWGWGDSSSGQLGNGTRVGSGAAEHVGTAHWKAVAASGRRSVGIQADGSLWDWGSTSLDSWAADQLTPRRVGDRTDWTDVVASDDAGLAIAADGTLWAWGSNALGELGDGSGVDSPTPVLVGGGRHWRSVAAGGQHVLAIADDGSLWGWGSNGCGEVGDGTTVTRTVPTQIGNVTTWSTVSAGPCTSAATRTNQTLWSWGVNEEGQLGLGDRTDRQAPTRVGSGTTWAAAFAGRDVMHAVTSDGQLWGWGTGWLGLATAHGGDTGQTLHPVRIGTDTGWTAVAEGNSAVVALRP